VVPLKAQNIESYDVALSKYSYFKGLFDLTRHPFHHLEEGQIL
jgi:hypothetical protein